MRVADLPLAVEGEVSGAEFVGETHCGFVDGRGVREEERKSE